MSLALGAAFLNHQVEQLQKSVSTRPQPGQGLKMNYARAVDPRESQGRPILAPALKSVRNEAKPQSVPRESSTERNEKSVPTKDADIVVVDSSVLVRGIAQLKAWCRDGREEVIIVPLEGTFMFGHGGSWLTCCPTCSFEHARLAQERNIVFGSAGSHGFKNPRAASWDKPTNTCSTR